MLKKSEIQENNLRQSWSMFRSFLVLLKSGCTFPPCPQSLLPKLGFKHQWSEWLPTPERPLPKSLPACWLEPKYPQELSHSCFRFQLSGQCPWLCSGDCHHHHPHLRKKEKGHDPCPRRYKVALSLCQVPVDRARVADQTGGPEGPPAGGVHPSQRGQDEDPYKRTCFTFLTKFVFGLCLHIVCSPNAQTEVFFSPD